MTVILTGFMGTGKSAVGRRLAERLGRSFHDTDSVIEEREGMPVREIFAVRGEPYFRECERRVVREICAGHEAVVSTGGGTILDDENFALLRSLGLLVCLHATPASIARRVRGGAASRPLLAGAGSLRERIERLLEQRRAAYARVPLQIDTTDRSIDAVADEILAALAAAEASPAP